MIEHFVVPTFSNLWWKGFVLSAVVIAVPIVIGRKLTDSNKLKLGLVMGIFLLLLTLSLHPYMIQKGVWSVQSSLPLQLCSISALLSGLVFFYKKQLIYELLVYWGLAGAIHSLLTPEISLGTDRYIVFEYYVAHAGIILAALYFSMVYGYKPRVGSWWRVFLITQLVMLSVGLFNLLVNANYMYLCKKPLADNPFIMGDWPWYVLGLEVAGVLHFGAVYLLFKLARHVHPKDWENQLNS